MNSFGEIFKISIFGESHGKSVGILIDGTPPGIPINTDDFIEDLKKRKPGLTGTTKRIEPDIPILRSGVFNGFSTGVPILIEFENKNINNFDYENIKNIPRPGHADLTSRIKYRGYNDYYGGGQFSGRLTTGLVAAGVLAKKILKSINFDSYLIEKKNDSSFNKRIKTAYDDGDSIGGTVECRINGLKTGIGEPFFDSIESKLSHIIFSIPGIKGIEFGDGFGCTSKMGSEFNDEIVSTDGKTSSNHSGGINGGISNGNEIVFRVAVRPSSSIKKTQETINLKTGKIEKLKIEGRHDTCFALRVPVIIEAVSAIVLADLSLISQTGV